MSLTVSVIKRIILVLLKSESSALKVSSIEVKSTFMETEKAPINDSLTFLKSKLKILVFTQKKTFDDQVSENNIPFLYRVIACASYYMR